MVNLNYISISILILVSCFEYSTTIKCWVCKEKDFPTECGVTFTPKPDTQITEIACEEVCVTFKNKWDGGTIVRNCTAGLWIPPTGNADMNGIHTLETCIKDKFTSELFCFCQKDLCNSNNTGDATIFAVNECSSNPCTNGGTCEDLYNKFKCHCPGNYDEPTCSKCKPGYGGATCLVELPPPCKSAPCLNKGTCVNELKTYTYNCQCVTGFNGTNCQNDIDECLALPCKNGGVCKDLPGKYECNCANTGYEGNNCEDEIDECELGKPCGKKGECMNTPPGSFSCKCSPGYTGRFCTEDIDECASNPCKNGACENLENEYSCTCFKGYTGTDCDIRIDYCVPSPCQNGGECTNDYVRFKYNCACVPGYTGTNCETKIDYCGTLFPCKFAPSDGCVDVAPTSWKCTCLPGYTGFNCTEDIDECAPKPCLNNGQCLNQINMYTCKCPAGYQGKNCGDEIYECFSNPCMNEASCTDLVNGYKCKCKDGFTGTLCETNINECASSPCKNTGTCIDLINSYGCICNTTYYTGKHCERPVMRCFEPDGVDHCNGNGDCDGGIGFQPITCTCFSGYTGQFCETRVSKCSTVACQNSGTCVEITANPGYKCVCNANFTGDLCQTRLSACKDQNINCFNGICEDIGSTYKCKCNAGYNGAFCTNKYFTCTEVGTFADPVYCEKFIYCTTDASGKLVTTTNTCSLLGTIQLLYDNNKKNCVFPTQHPNPGCATASG